GQGESVKQIRRNSSVDQAVVFAVCSDPEPNNAVGYGDSESAVTKPDADRPELSELFEMQGRMSGIVLQ
ncbi:MAG TPA: hypothetical protein VN642_14630, partial [Dongiaceae bacterium]|nr:hypothetical protein [Dongiaceae bacterium]